MLQKVNTTFQTDRTVKAHLTAHAQAEMISLAYARLIIYACACAELNDFLGKI